MSPTLRWQKRWLEIESASSNLGEAFMGEIVGQKSVLMGAQSCQDTSLFGRHRLHAEGRERDDPLA